MNKIEVLKDDTNRWVTDKNELRGMAEDFFKRLYSKENQFTDSVGPLRGLFPKLDSV